jgi:transposase-like protein
MPIVSSHQLAELIDVVSNLPPDRIADVEAALGDARRRAEASTEVDGAAHKRACPHCGGVESIRWGKCRTGIHRWRCKSCDKTWTGRTGTSIAHIHRPGLLLDVVRNMMGNAPLSCRRLADDLNLSRHTVWRWRMMILNELDVAPSALLQGIVETDDTGHRESRKGSREWVRHFREPARHPAPPRKRWKDWGRNGPPGAITMAWREHVLATTDRSGALMLEHMPDKTLPSIDAALVPLVAGDAMLLFDGAPQYEKIARARKLGYKVLIAGKRSPTAPASYHLNTVNNVHSSWKAFLRPFCGPASKNLNAYAHWFLARRAGYLPAFRAMLS